MHTGSQGTLKASECWRGTHLDECDTVTFPWAFAAAVTPYQRLVCLLLGRDNAHGSPWVSEDVLGRDGEVEREAH